MSLLERMDRGRTKLKENLRDSYVIGSIMCGMLTLLGILTAHMLGLGCRRLHVKEHNLEVQMDSKIVHYLLSLSGKTESSQECCGIQGDLSCGIGI